MMEVNHVKGISKVISLLDKHILNILSQKEIDDDKLAVLSDIRVLYIEELNGIIRSKNTREMFDKKYRDSYRKNNNSIW